MLGQHPELAGLPELKLFCCPTVGDLEASLPKFWIDRGVAHRSPGLVRAVAELEFGSQIEETLTAARAWLHERPDWTGADVMDVLLERLHPRIAVEKSPDNTSTDDALQRMASAYPGARYLHLTRHPVTTQRSMQAHRRRSVPSEAEDGEPMAGIGAWYDVHRRILQFGATLPGDRYLQVRSEDVLNDTHAQLQAIAAWLNIRADNDAIEDMRHPENSPFARLAPAASGVAGGNDPAFLRDPIPHTVESGRPLQPPAGWVADPSVWGLVVDLAHRLGYSDLP